MYHETITEQLAELLKVSAVEVIKQLDGMEAALVRPMLQSVTAIPIAQLRLTTVGEEGYEIVATHLLDLLKGSKAEPVEEPQLPAMIDNWVRLGLVEVDYKQYFVASARYDWVEARPEYIRLRKEHESEKVKLIYQKGMMFRTQFGQRFAAAVSNAAGRHAVRTLAGSSRQYGGPTPLRNPVAPPAACRPLACPHLSFCMVVCFRI